jgi:hypothetical protein
MPPLYPPEYPYRPDAPLLSLGPAFSEEIARSLVGAIWHENLDQPHETGIRTAAGLTMLEAFHPRDQLQTMLAAQCVAVHCAIMDSLRCAAHPKLAPQLAIKFRANVVSMNRMFCLNLRELAHLQSRPLPPRPGQPPTSPMPTTDPSDNSPAETPPKRPVRASPSAAKVADPIAAETLQPVADPVGPLAARRLEDIPELPEDIETRPDGTPGNLTAYVPKPPVVPYVPPREAPIMVALATRPKPWRMVNVPKDQAPICGGDVAADSNPPAAALPEPERHAQRGPVDLRERIFTGDALAQFAARRLDPDAPIEPLRFDDDHSVVELELISTGGDPSAEADKAAMQAAHPEGKAIVTFRYGTEPPPADPALLNGKDNAPPDR